MKNYNPRRKWLKSVTFAMTSLLVSENLLGKSTNSGTPRPGFNPNKALAAPGDNIKITKLEIIPVNSLRTVFVKMHTDAGVIGLGEGTVEGRIPTTMAAIQELEKYG